MAVIERLSTGARIDHLSYREQREAKRLERKLLDAVNGAATEVNFLRVKDTRRHVAYTAACAGRTPVAAAAARMTWDSAEESFRAEAVRLEEVLAAARRELAEFVSQFPED